MSPEVAILEHTNIDIFYFYKVLQFRYPDFLEGLLATIENCQEIFSSETVACNS